MIASVIKMEKNEKKSNTQYATDKEFKRALEETIKEHKKTLDELAGTTQ